VWVHDTEDGKDRIVKGCIKVNYSSRNPTLVAGRTYGGAQYRVGVSSEPKKPSLQVGADDLLLLEEAKDEADARRIFDARALAPPPKRTNEQAGTGGAAAAQSVSHRCCLLVCVCVCVVVAFSSSRSLMLSVFLFYLCICLFFVLFLCSFFPLRSQSSGSVPMDTNAGVVSEGEEDAPAVSRSTEQRAPATTLTGTVPSLQPASVPRPVYPMTYSNFMKNHLKIGNLDIYNEPAAPVKFSDLHYRAMDQYGYLCGYQDPSRWHTPPCKNRVTSYCSQDSVIFCDEHVGPHMERHARMEANAARRQRELANVAQPAAAPTQPAAGAAPAPAADAPPVIMDASNSPSVAHAGATPC
jgi:hypothetical protein